MATMSSPSVQTRGSSASSSCCVQPMVKPPRRTGSSSTSSSMKRTAAPQVPSGPPPVVPKMSPAPTAPADVSSNGKGPAPLSYSSGEPADDVNMNEVDEKVTLDVLLASSGKSMSVTVDSNIPMLDLLVHLAARCKVSPSGHVLEVLDPETGRAVDFKANHTVGSLGATCVHLVPKKSRAQAAKAGKGQQAMGFEITQRFSINLPGGQKAVMRVSPQMTLGEVLGKVCRDKSLDTARYTPTLPASASTASRPPLTPLPLHLTIADSKLSEINLVYTADARQTQPTQPAPNPVPPAASMWAAGCGGQDVGHTPYMPGAGESKKKKGFLSFLTKKEKKFKLEPAPHPHHNHHMDTASNASNHSATTTSSSSSARAPAPRSTTPPPPSSRPSPSSSSRSQPARRPHTMYVTSTPQDSPRELTGLSPRAQDARRDSPRGEVKGSPESRALPTAGGGKKRPAPPPPSQAKVPAVKEDVLVKASAPPVAASAPAGPSTGLTSPPADSSSGRKDTTTTTTTQDAAQTNANNTEVTAGAGGQSGATTAASSLLHSRNSSDSSGYHELTFSGAESPEAPPHPAFKTSIDTTSIDSGDNLNGGGGDSGVHDGAEGWSQQQGVGTGTGIHAAGDPAKTLPSTKKKKKAPPPPPSSSLSAASAPGKSPEEEQRKECTDDTDLTTAMTSGETDLTTAMTSGDTDLTTAMTSGDTDLTTATTSTTPSSGARQVPPPRPPPPQAATEEVEEEEVEVKEEKVAVEVRGESDRVPQEQHGLDTAASLRLNLDFLEESDTGTDTDRSADIPRTNEATAAEATTTTTTTDSDSKEAFDLDDILNSVVFDEEPRRASTINIHNIPNGDEDSERSEMMMMETASVVSEGVEEEVVGVVGRSSRPCEFIPPPPPVEPPPEEYTPRGSELRRYADKGTVVGEDNVSLAPASLRNSPVAKASSEAEDSGRSSSDDLSDLPAPLPPPPTPSLTSLPPLGPPLSGEEEHEAEHRVVHQERLQEHVQQGSQDGPEHRPWATPLPGEEAEEEVTGNAFVMTEEISAPLETVPPPLQFQTKEEEEEKMEKREEEEEENREEAEEEKREEEKEEVVTVTEEYIVPVGPGGLDFRAAVKVSEEKEKSRVQNESCGSWRGVENRERDGGRDGERDGERDGGRDGERDGETSAADSPRDVVQKAEPERLTGRHQQRQHLEVAVGGEESQPPGPQPPAAREEFVLTVEDLSSLSLVPLRPKRYTRPRTLPHEEDDTGKEGAGGGGGGGSPQRSHLHLAYVSDHGHVQPARHSPSSSAHLPSSHTATGTLASLPSTAPCVSQDSPARTPEEGPTSSFPTPTGGRYRSSAKLTIMGGASLSGTPCDGSREEAEERGSPRTAEGREAAQGGELQQQYSALQRQMAEWQQQLQHNQTLLATQGGGSSGGGAAPDDTLRTLQMQMQMQQQMMEQLQKSMQALTLQQQQQKEQQQQGSSGSPRLVSSQTPQVTVTPPPPPPPPAPAPSRSVARPTTGKKVMTQPVTSRLQSQLDPREELMIAIRSVGGIAGLKTVPVRDTRWASNSQ
ncbi:uncharacterized protein LOC143276742 isoform X3 [Babylonia areolata]|uniref:uncharacterized protein LOC143276742 isoform X3 n=1 Tax=Babylonia areolata TaxID=304850 RepID=UPI003FD07E0A